MGIPRILYYKFKLDRNLKKTRQQIKELQEKKLHNLLFYAYDHSKFYQKLYQKNDITRNDLSEIKIEELPVVNKEMVMNNFNDIVTRKNISREKVEKFLEEKPAPTSLLENKYRVIHTSGSTGRLGYFLYNKREWDLIKAVSLRMFNNFGLKPKKYAFIGASDGHYAGISLFLSPINHLEEIFYDDYLIMNINKPLGKYLKELDKLNPHNLTGYSSAISMLAEKQLKKELNISPDTIIGGGEPFFKKDREKIKEAWGVEPVNYYAASESLMIGIERPKANALYILDDINYIELEDDRTLLTNLYNYTQPLIRYQISDILIPEEKEKSNSPQDWPFRRVKKLLGRREDKIWFKNKSGDKDFIHPVVLVEFYVAGLEKFQIIQNSKESFIIKTVISKKYSDTAVQDKIIKKMKGILQDKNLSNVDFQVKKVSDIPPDPETGKFKLIKKEMH